MVARYKYGKLFLYYFPCNYFLGGGRGGGEGGWGSSRFLGLVNSEEGTKLYTNRRVGTTVRQRAFLLSCGGSKPYS